MNANNGHDHGPRRWAGRLAAVALGLGLAGSTITGVAAAEPLTGAARAAVPASFQAQSISWTSGRQGWLLGSAPCGSRRCTDLLATADGGARWRTVGTVPAPLSGPGTHGVSEIRFTNSKWGWAFGPDLYATTDAGQSWDARRIPGNGKQILALAAGRAATYVVVSRCPPGTGQCNDQPLSLWKSTAAHPTRWAKLNLTLPANIGAQLAVFGSTVYVVDPLRPAAPDRFYAATDGHTFHARPVPCPDPADTSLVDLVATSPRDVTMLCVGDPGMGHSVKAVFRSVDTARTATPAGQPDLAGISSQLAASRAGDLAVTSVGGSPGSSYIYAKPAVSNAWTTPVTKQDDGGHGWNDVVFSTRRTAWVIYGAANWSGPGQLWTTHDGGAHWHPVTLAN